MRWSRGLTEALRLEVAALGIAVTLVEPGDYHTGFTDARRRTAASGIGSAYAEAFDRAFAAMAGHERNAATPEPVARKIAAILETPRPRLRHPIGRALDLLAVSLRPWIPAALHERWVRDHYDL